MDTLLAVSTQEEDLNRSLQHLEASLIHARNILQASYTEVLRLLPLRQQVMVTRCGYLNVLWRTGMFTIFHFCQCIDEANRMRARRIEILRTMQGAAN